MIDLLQLAPVRTSSPADARGLAAAFRESCVRNADRPAVTDGDKILTYAELLMRSEDVARALRSLGLPANSLVGVCLERSAALVVGIVGVLLAGHAYLPLDPAYPEARLQATCADALPAALVLNDPALLSSTPARRLFVQDVERGGSGLPMIPDDPDAIAYVLYTSGSTGVPKGVVVSHRNVLRLFTSAQAVFQFSAEDVWTMFHSASFDFSVWEMWGPLLTGGRLVMVPFEVSRSPEQFRALLSREGVTVLNQTPTAFRLLDEADRFATDALALRYVIFGGEALILRSLLPWITRHGDAHPQLFNLYGITETTVHVTVRRVLLHDAERETDSLIGDPLPDLQLYLLDETLCSVPSGAVGEIYVGGAGVAQGYLRQPALTAERFLEDPSAPGGTTRMYRSGDLARRRADGELVYLGRADRQVKINGFRIELAEVEATLLRSPAVQQLAVALLPNDSAGPRLATWFTLCPGATIADVTLYAAANLPLHMRPSIYLPVDRLPLTLNGKLDLDALPKPRHTALILAPGSFEQELAAICHEIFGREISPEENFFDAGATSVQLIALRTRLEQGLKRTIPITWLFQHTCVAALARKLNQEASPTTADSPVVADSSRRSAQRGAWLAAQARRKHSA